VSVSKNNRKNRTINIIIRHELGLKGSFSVPSNSLFKGFSSSSPICSVIEHPILASSCCSLQWS